MLRSYLREILCQIPDRSGLPSVVRGAGAVRSGLRSAVRGMLGVGWSTHCPASGVVNAYKMVAKTTVFMRTSCFSIRPEELHKWTTPTLRNAHLTNLPPRCSRSRLFSQAFSITSVLGIRRACSLTVHGFV